MIAKLLIANRGEIARRIIRACRKLGVAAVAVHSEADAGLAHVREADDAVAIGPAAARDSYLRADALLEAARRSGADAVHPGYGFLSENAGFAEAVRDAGLVWVGPAPETIRAMGDKQRARQIAIAADVPVAPASARFEPGDVSGVVEAATAVGFPLLVKAAAGGGGIGMRRVDGPDAVSATVEATQSMAARAFGDGAVFLERFIPRARHVEIQVFGFGDGAAVHFFERDCSLQRRFQKVIEESPAPGLAPETRAAMAAAALRLCRETRYAGAGTVEFILDAETQDFFFLEMNTRIQVEHPVTEITTGADLVAMQILFAGDALDRRGQIAGTDGAAIECRLYAENPKKMFFPSPGRLERFRLPPEDASLRIDSAYAEGDEITPHYDPLVAKVIAHGPDRDAARLRAIAALREIDIEGIRNNRDFLIACLEHPDFVAGHVSTDFIERHLKELTG